MAYRERREARIERLNEWAAKRADKATDLHKANEPYRGDHAFNTQPGHIPERARANARSHKAYEHTIKAEQMSQRASGIASQLAGAIYSDDPDAIEQLEARIVTLETKRDDYKARNAAFRKAHKAELKDLTAYGRDQVLPAASFTLKNLSADIRRNQKRLELLRKRPIVKFIYARRDGECPDCDDPIEQGSVIANPDGVWMHGTCARTNHGAG